MVVHIEIPSAVEAEIRARATAEGKDAAALVRELVLERFGNGNHSLDPDSTDARLKALERIQELARQWDADRPPRHTVDDSRESIYEGRGE